MKNYVLLLLLSLLIASCKVDPKDAIGIDKLQTVNMPTTTKSVGIEIVEKVWDTTYVVDLTNDANFTTYQDKIKSIKLNGVNYLLNKFDGDGIVDSGKISVYLDTMEPEITSHTSFSNDVKNVAIYKINNAEKITKAQQIVNDTKKLKIKVVVDLDKAPTKPIKFGFDFKLDIALLVNLADL